MALNTGPLDWESSALTTRPLLQLLQIYHFLDSFVFFVFVFEYFQLKHVSLFILDQYLIAVNFSLSESPCLFMK